MGRVNQEQVTLAKKKNAGRVMSALTTWIDKTLYPSYESGWDHKRFRAYLLERVKPSDIVLDYGAGRGGLPEMNIRVRVRTVAGVDPSEVVLENPFLDEAKVLPLPSGVIPFKDNSFDVVFSSYVLEHVVEPEVCFREIWRVLKPGGQFIARTPNRWHYVPLVARVTPHSFHVYITRLRGRKEQDTFPTLYRCNTLREVRKYAQQVGFELRDLEAWEGRPEYLRMAAPLYLLGYAYERLVNASPIFGRFRSVLVFTLTKPAHEHMSSATSAQDNEASIAER